MPGLDIDFPLHRRREDERIAGKIKDQDDAGPVVRFRTRYVGKLPSNTTEHCLCIPPSVGRYHLHRSVRHMNLPQTSRSTGRARTLTLKRRIVSQTEELSRSTFGVGFLRTPNTPSVGRVPCDQHPQPMEVLVKPTCSGVRVICSGSDQLRPAPTPPITAPNNGG